MRYLLVSIMIFSLAACATWPQAAPQKTSAGSPLPLCQDEPGCISSLASRPDYVSPFMPRSGNDATWQAIIETIGAEPNTTITHVDEHRLVIHRRSGLGMLKHEIELRRAPQKQIIHVRLSQHSGLVKLPPNRMQLEQLRRQLRQNGLIRS